MNYRIGVLGGMGPLATHYFLDIFFRRFTAEMKPTCDQDYPDMTILMESSTPDRTEAIKKKNPEAAQKINRDLQKLANQGCKDIVVPCFTGHSMIEEKWFSGGVIDMRQAAIDRFSSFKDSTVAVLATDGSLMTGVFEPLKKHFEILYPEGADQEDVMKVIYDSKGENPDPSGTVKLLQSVKEKMRRKGAELCLAGCTEIEMFAGTNNAGNGMILPMDCLCSILIEKMRTEKPIVNSR